MSQLKLPPYQKRKTSATQRPTTIGFKDSGSPTGKPPTPLGYGMSKNQECPDLPDGVIPLESQVAGHAFHKGTDSIGLLKCMDDGSILKPAGKMFCGIREIKFYEQIQEATEEKDLLPLSRITSQYRGHQKLLIDGHPIEFIKLEDLTGGMHEPCVMDIKIGKRSWDPLATPEKQQYEDSKYRECRQTYGFCLPGFQFYSLTNGRQMRYGKEYGKKLNESTVREAFRKFLNADVGYCRQLLIQVLTDLWNIQKWARSQTSFRLYASSILIVYDARRLKPVLQRTPKCLSNVGTATSPNTSSPGSPATPTLSDCSGVEPLQHYFKIQRNHSNVNNYEEDMKTMKENYVFMLDNLVGSYEEKVWAKARMIDFAHTFAVEDKTIDDNYLFGVDNLVKIFETFLRDCEIQNAPKPGVA